MTHVSLAMIVRDASSTLRACLESLRPHVDSIVIVDTGSTDDSPAIAKEFATRWERYTGCNVDPRTGQETDLIWDFSDARNRSFVLVPDEATAVLWVDADDVVQGAENLRAMAAAMPEAGNSAYLIPYEYSYDGAGRPTCVHWRERLIKPPKDFSWTTPCHEVCIPRTPGGLQALPGGQVLIKHRAQEAAAMPGAKPREGGRNLRILQAYLQRVDEGDPRAMYYAGVEYARVSQFGKARETLRRYVQLSSWDDERCLAELELARIYLHEGECQEAIRWAMQAMTTKDWPNPYWLLVQAFFRMAMEGPDSKQEYNLRRAIAWAERGRPLQDAETVLFYDPTERFTTDRTIARILAHWGEIDAAAEACRRGLAGIPGDPDLMDQLRKYEKVRIGREIDTSLSRLVHLGALDERTKGAIEALVSGQLALPPANDAVPDQFARVGSAPPVDEATLPPVPDGKLDIVIFTGPAFEHWTPATIEASGIGGSETMAWEMARGLARLGHRVRHYGWCAPEQEGVYEGVHWFDASRYAGVRCDVLVVSRYAVFVDVPVEAKARLLYMHDVHSGPSLTPERALRFDRILCLSQWHKDYVSEVYPYLDPGRIVVTRNGIDLSLFETHPPELPVERNPHRAVYSSSPDRGLQTALELWPLVRAEVPDAELHVYYGFDNLRKGRPADVALADKLEAQAKATPGVVLHGRVSPRELAREFMASGVWFYPTWFSETSCITAMQAQAAGLYCVTSPIAALNETVSEPGWLIPGAPGPIDIANGFECAPCSDGFKRAFVAAVIEAMTREPRRPIETRSYLRRYADERFGLESLASDWSAMLHSLVDSLAENPIPPFYVAPVFEAAARGVDEGEAA